MPFRDNLRSARKNRRLSQEDLAELLQVSRQAVSKWEQGSCMPEAKMLLQISEKLDVSLDALMSDAAVPGAGREAAREEGAKQKLPGKSVLIALLVFGALFSFCIAAVAVWKPRAAVFTTEEDRKTLTTLAGDFAQAYFAQDVDAVASFLSRSFEGNPKDVSPWTGIETFLVKGVDAISTEKADKTKVVAVEFRNPDYPDSFLYLTIVFVKEQGAWRVRSFYLEA